MSHEWFHLEMPMMVHVRTNHSDWFFNQKTHQYIRVPREDVPQGNDATGSSYHLRNLWWMPYTSVVINAWNLTSKCSDKCCPHLVIEHEDGKIVASNAKLIARTNHKKVPS